MLEFREYPGSKQFEIHALSYLRGAVERFFGGRVKYDSHPIAALRHQHNIDITASPRRGVYLVDDATTAIVLGRVLQGREVKAAFSLQIRGAPFVGLERLLSIFEAALAITLSRAAELKFDVPPHHFGDQLVEFAISKFFSKGYYDHRTFRRLIELFHTLSGIRFEGRNFTTGLVLTRSFYAYAEKGNHTREGKLYQLAEARKLSAADTVDKRFWYLADGQTSFFLANPKLEVSNLFMTHSTRQGVSSFVDDYTLSSTVKGGDALFRVLSQGEFSVTGANGFDFNFKEGRWRVRNLLQTAEVVQQALNVPPAFVQSFLYYVFYLSRRRLSSILWVPTNTDGIESLLLSKNRLTREPLSLLEASHTQTLVRLLSSDGASIFDPSGQLLSFGSVVDISKISISGMKGTGESVASLLGKNGICVKVSQDGTIKLFAQSLPAPLVF